MAAGTIATHFAIAERASSEVVARQAAQVQETSPLVQLILDAVPDIVMVLNGDRQIVFANRSLFTLLGRDVTEIRGLRPGEVLSCLHAFEHIGGCGTTEFCQTCGGVRAILTGLAGQRAVQECRITRRGGAESLDLRVTATPLEVEGENFTVFALVDISHEKRRRALERIFFHDVLNTATSLRVSIDLMLRSADPNQFREVVRTQVEKLIDEVVAQRQLNEAEGDDLAVNLAPVNAGVLLKEMVRVYGSYVAARSCQLRIEEPSEELVFVSDQTLLGRVVGNMLKNAVEASRAGDTITLGCASQGDGVEFWVHNPGCMPHEVQLQVFQRSFSTKGSGRGLGTYSMKLLTERYLSGRVGFATSEQDGTVFYAWYPFVPDEQ